MSRYQLSPIFGVDQNGQAAEGLFQKVGWMFKIIVDAERRVLVVETSGLGTVEEVAKFAKEKEAMPASETVSGVSAGRWRRRRVAIDISDSKGASWIA